MSATPPAKIVLIGASTGGPGVIEKLIAALPPAYPYPVCIVQHFPAELTASFATRLQMRTANRVVESSDRLELSNGMVVVAKGGEHLTFERTPSGVLLRHRPASEGKRQDFVPSVDDMFLSAANVWRGDEILAVLLTGIGDDGVEGIGRISQKGGMTVCQDEKSCAVFGMPARAIEKGSASAVLSPEEIIQAIIGFMK